MNDNKSGQPDLLDDLLDEILQKNMEEIAGHNSSLVIPTSEFFEDEGLDDEWEDDGEIGVITLDELEDREEKEDFPGLLTISDILGSETGSKEETKGEAAGDESTDSNESHFERISDKSDDDYSVIEVEVGSKEDKKPAKKEIIAIIVYVAVIFFITLMIVTFIGQRTRVSGSSMENTLSHGDNLIIDKISYKLSDPKRFDIIIFPYQYEEDTYYIKRIIGLPGETVFINDEGVIYIDGKVLKENYGKEPILDPGLADQPIKLDEDEYFVLGDNRNNSSDSRFAGVGEVRRRYIIGKALIRIYPFNRIRRF